MDITSKTEFLIDTGADISLIPPSLREKLNKSNLKLLAANKTQIDRFGIKRLILNLGFRWPFEWLFTIADVERCIIGADFLKQYALLVDIKNKRLLDPLSNIAVSAIYTTISSYQITTFILEVLNPKFQTLLSQFKFIFNETDSFNTIKHGITHCIETTGPPVSAKVRRLSTEKIKIAKDEIDL